jgi:hypothetical protein
LTAFFNRCIDVLHQPRAAEHDNGRARARLCVWNTNQKTRCTERTNGQHNPKAAGSHTCHVQNTGRGCSDAKLQPLHRWRQRGRGSHHCKRSDSAAEGIFILSLADLATQSIPDNSKAKKLTNATDAINEFTLPSFIVGFSVGAWVSQQGKPEI